MAPDWPVGAEARTYGVALAPPAIPGPARRVSVALSAGGRPRGRSRRRSVPGPPPLARRHRTAAFLGLRPACPAGPCGVARALRVARGARAAVPGAATRAWVPAWGMGSGRRVPPGLSWGSFVPRSQCGCLGTGGPCWEASSFGAGGGTTAKQDALGKANRKGSKSAFTFWRCGTAYLSAGLASPFSELCLFSFLGSLHLLFACYLNVVNCLDFVPFC